MNWVKIGDAPTQGNYITKTAEKIRPEGLSKTREVHPGDLILSNSMSFGKPYIMGIDGCIHDGWLLIRNTYGVFDLTFLCHLLGTPQMLSQYRSLAAGSTVNNLNKELVGNTYVTIPSITEQRVLGAYLEQLDNLITLHQRKFEKLTNVKKSMLEKMFPQNGSSYPEIRFKGFTDPWEQRKAIDIADYSKGNGYSKGDLTDAGTPIILYGRLYTKYQFAISEVDTFAFPRNGAVYSQGNEVIVPASGETAEDIARASAVEKSGVLLGGDLNILRPFDFINPLFLALAISNGEPQKELAKKAQGKSVVHIHNTDIQEVTIAYPSRTEQDRIVSVFRQLDNLITLHQRKCVFLFSFFRACISMNFTASTFSWEQRKLSELTSMHARIGWQNLRTSEFLDSGDYMLITGTDFNDGAINFSTCHYVERERYEQDRNIQIHNGSILITKDGTLGKVAYVQGLSMPATLNAGVFNVQIKDANNVDERYLFQYLKAPFLMDYVDKKATGGTIKHLNQSILVDFPVILPQRSEQILIGAFFQQLDNLITLHQRELEKLQKIKKSMLEKMFV